MKKKLSIFALALSALLAFTSCEDDYYAPVFTPDEAYCNLPYEIPAMGGSYDINFHYEYIYTKNSNIFLEWTFRVLIDGKVYDVIDVDSMVNESVRSDYKFTVNIPKNASGHMRPIVIEASYHADTYEVDWTDWEPIASAVQYAVF